MRAVTKTTHKDKRGSLVAVGLILVGLGEAVGLGVVRWVVVDHYAVGLDGRESGGLHSYGSDVNDLVFVGKEDDEKVRDELRNPDVVALQLPRQSDQLAVTMATNMPL